MSSQWLGQHGAQPPNAGQVPVVTSILKDFSAEALGELRTWLEQNPPAITIQSIVGFSQFAAQSATVAADESTASAAWVNLTTTGPEVTGLSDGKYVIQFGAGTYNTSATAQQNYLAPSLNGATPTAANQIRCDSNAATIVVPASRSITATLSGGAAGNTVRLQYSAGGGTSHFLYRWLVVLRVSNV